MAYKDILRNAITTYEDLEKWLTGQKARVDPRLRDVIAKYPMRVNTYYLGLIQKMNDPIWKQAIPDVEELEHHMDLVADPLDEEGDIRSAARGRSSTGIPTGCCSSCRSSARCTAGSAPASARSATILKIPLWKRSGRASSTSRRTTRSGTC